MSPKGCSTLPSDAPLARAEPQSRPEGRFGTDPFAFFAFICGSMFFASPAASDDVRGMTARRRRANEEVSTANERKKRKCAGNRAGTEQGIRSPDRLSPDAMPYPRDASMKSVEQPCVSPPAWVRIASHAPSEQRQVAPDMRFAPLARRTESDYLVTAPRRSEAPGQPATRHPAAQPAHNRTPSPI